MEAERAATISIVEPDPSVRRRLASLLTSAGYRAPTFPSWANFLKSLPTSGSAGCLVVDIAIVEVNGLLLEEALAQVPPGLPFVFITADNDVPTCVRAMKAGAVDVLLKPFQDGELLQAIATALERKAREGNEHAARRRTQQLINSLTTREREVMFLVVSGKLNKQIADELGTCLQTIKKHRARVMQKMAVRSLAELVLAVEKTRFSAADDAPQLSQFRTEDPDAARPNSPRKSSASPGTEEPPNRGQITQTCAPRS